VSKGSKCPECNKSTGAYDKGAYHCQNEKCGSIWWTQFDKPSAGAKRKGYTCHICSKMTVHPLGIVSGAKLWRCSTCAVTIVAPKPVSA